MKIRGKRLTSDQRKNVLENGFEGNINDYLLQKVKHVDANGSKNTSRLKEKHEVYYLIHKEDGSLKEIHVRNIGG